MLQDHVERASQRLSCSEDILVVVVVHNGTGDDPAEGHRDHHAGRHNFMLSLVIVNLTGAVLITDLYVASSCLDSCISCGCSVIL